MNRQTIVRLSLWFTAPFNVLAGYAFAFPGSDLARVIELPLTAVSFYSLFSGAIKALFGGCYVWLALQREISLPLLFVGASGKLIAVTLSWVLWSQGQFSFVALSLISGDILFVVLWFHYLLHHHNQGAA